MISGLHHFSIIVSSEASVSFYEKLGFKEVFRKERSYDCVVIMDGIGVQLELFIDPKHPKRAQNPENLGLRAVSFKVDDFDRLSKQFECSSVMTDWFGQRYCTVTDPDGLPIQLHE